MFVKLNQIEPASDSEEIFETVPSEQFDFWRFKNNLKFGIFASPRIFWESATVKHFLETIFPIRVGMFFLARPN